MGSNNNRFAVNMIIILCFSEINYISLWKVIVLLYVHCTTYFKIYISEIKFWEQGRSASTKISKKGFGLLYFEVHYRTCDPALCLKSSYPVVHTSASIVPIAHWNWIFIVLVENKKFNIPSATEPFHLVDFLSELYQRCWIRDIYHVLKG